MWWRQKKFGNDVIVIFLIICQFRAIWKPDSRCMVHGPFLVFQLTFHLTKSENRTKKSFTTALILLLWKKVKFWLFAEKSWNQQHLGSPGEIFLKQHMCLYFRYGFQVSSIILTSSCQEEVILWIPTSKQAPKKYTQIRVNETVLHRNTYTLSFGINLSLYW